MQIRVAVADDHAFFRKLICDWLSSLHGFFDFEIAGEAKNGLEAIDLVNEKQPDLLLLDLSMPKLDGISALKQMKADQQNQKLKTVIISAHISIQYWKKALEAGANGYCTKHDSLDQLLEAIQQVLNGNQYISPECESI